MSALYGTFTLEEMIEVSILIAKDLKLNVMGVCEIFSDELAFTPQGIQGSLLH